MKNKIIKKIILKVRRKNVDSVFKILRKRIIDHNVRKINYQRKYLAFCYYQAKKLIAGLYAYQGLGMFFIDILWVDELYRHQGLGSKLLHEIEKYAIKNKALYIRLNTGSFQAPKFYLKNGYQQFAKLPLLSATKKKYYDHYFIKYIKK